MGDNPRQGESCVQDKRGIRISSANLSTRRSGVLLHPSSLPGPGSIGELGQEAFRFIDVLHSANQRLWQTLPLGPTHADMSPYQSLSSNAGNPALIDLAPLIQKGLISSSDLSPKTYENVLLAKRRCISDAWHKINGHLGEFEQDFFAFCEKQSDWLHDYALYIALKNSHSHSAWTEWPQALRDRDRKALETFYEQHKSNVDAIKFEQFLFFEQWNKLKTYANQRDIEIIGDLPIFVAHDSAEVWSDRKTFLLDENGHSTIIAGVPPDYFSETGQRWGNPLYDWNALAQDGFQWWIKRIENQLELFDLIRIDHFRGFESYWAIPADEETAINGEWKPAPGEKLFNALRGHFGSKLPFIAEDLGIITPEVDALREQFDLPGMKILQFAFDENNDNPYLPHKHTNNSVVYTGTHDNNTTVGWFEELTDDTRQYVYRYLLNSQEDIHWLLIETALASTANTCVIPFQDILGLDGEHRMNTPGTTEGNWRWRFEWDWLKEEQIEKLRQLTHMYQR